jgi:hypothetical protein
LGQNRFFTFCEGFDRWVTVYRDRLLRFKFLNVTGFFFFFLQLGFRVSIFEDLEAQLQLIWEFQSLLFVSNCSATVDPWRDSVNFEICVRKSHRYLGFPQAKVACYRIQYLWLNHFVF